jgi:hypothetical protein
MMSSESVVNFRAVRNTDVLTLQSWASSVLKKKPTNSLTKKTLNLIISDTELTTEVTLGEDFTELYLVSPNGHDQRKRATLSVTISLKCT